MPNSDTDTRLLLLAPDDSVYVLRDRIAAGETIAVDGLRVTVPRDLGLGHKIARVAVPMGGKVIKYGAPIGSASVAIAPGEHVHVHNLQSDYTATHTLDAARAGAQGER